ncbi:hypothetical protein [Paracoccus sp. MKU1]|uniref:hypothetical protein n=1 Tax=Paracoccus sp. MKU1 TaxID=1745182 RepID=UPI00137A6BCA|nr:hypothetical protein [Paracoccus sp. MKU1]
MIEPVITLALMSVVFSLFLWHLSLDTSFPPFYALRRTRINLYMNVGNNVAQSEKLSRPPLEFQADAPFGTILALFLPNRHDPDHGRRDHLHRHHPAA